MLKNNCDFNDKATTRMACLSQICISPVQFRAEHRQANRLRQIGVHKSSVFSSIRYTLQQNNYNYSQTKKIFITRKRAIAKALHLEGRTTSAIAPDILVFFQVCLNWKYCFRTFCEVRLGTAAWSLRPPRALLNKYDNETYLPWICVGCYVRCDLDLWPFDHEPRIGCHVVKLCAKFERNRSMHARVIAI